MSIGAALEAILMAPRLRRRAGVTYEFTDSKITKYERDRTEVGVQCIDTYMPVSCISYIDICIYIDMYIYIYMYSVAILAQALNPFI